jgi:hypothetical protein
MLQRALPVRRSLEKNETAPRRRGVSLRRSPMELRLDWVSAPMSYAIVRHGI